MNRVFFTRDSNVSYPSSDEEYSPHLAYPEYPFSHLSEQKNMVYDMVRQGFWSLGLDASHRGTPQWNPLGDLIQLGQSVLIKPNWVMHKNEEQQFHNMECMVTHPSVIRVVVDYVVIALKGTGKITIADAPIQSCDFAKLMEEMHYNKLWTFYSRQDVPLTTKDLRDRIIDSSSVNKTYQVTKSLETGILVNLGQQSAFEDLDAACCRKFRITSYDPDILLSHHTPLKHEYLISRETLDADVILNLAKPKAHRKAGLTACSKNLIGTCSRKEYLPHHSVGAISEGGDEYLRKNWLRRLDGHCIDQYNRASCRETHGGSFYRLLHRVLGRMTRSSYSDAYTEGSWYGNDTIWRTIVDLNRIVQFADCEGQMHTKPQRRLFHICDMILTGEGEGPLLPSPKKIGSIVMGDENAAVDRFICSLVGFDPHAVRYLAPLLERSKLCASDLLIVDANEDEIPFNNYPFLQETHIQPPSGWVGHIEAPAFTTI